MRKNQDDAGFSCVMNTSVAISTLPVSSVCLASNVKKTENEFVAGVFFAKSGLFLPQASQLTVLHSMSSQTNELKGRGEQYPSGLRRC